MFGISFNRERMRRMLWKSPVDFVIEGPLNPTPAEEIQKDRGFWPVEYASVINNDRASCKFENRYLASCPDGTGIQEARVAGMPQHNGRSYS